MAHNVLRRYKAERNAEKLSDRLTLGFNRVSRMKDACLNGG